MNGCANNKNFHRANVKITLNISACTHLVNVSLRYASSINLVFVSNAKVVEYVPECVVMFVRVSLGVETALLNYQHFIILSPKEKYFV